MTRPNNGRNNLNLLIKNSYKTRLSKNVTITKSNNLIIAGALVHLVFEYSPLGNLNEKWCKIIFENDIDSIKSL